MSSQSQAETGRIWLGAAVLAAISGALLTSGCGMRDEASEASAAAVGAQVREARAGGDRSDQLADLEARVDEAQRGAKQEIEQARKQSEDYPVAAREQLTIAIERTESAREDVSDRLDELKRANDAGWDVSRRRVIEALEELADARREVVAAFAGGEHNLSDG